MKNPLLLSFVVLVTLTLCTGLLSYFELISVRYIPLALMGLAMVKFGLVAFEFMELRKAHGLWKVSTLLIGLILAGGISFFAFS
ncbi:cytochrome C oxidase subunit IV family protein [Algoriphagus sp.]|uniref:cytochrome C oxidase subunit IV family protein n=1 Tax=Algoriphagus sp. TaxID=1872435 RepID=UPI00326A69E1